MSRCMTATITGNGGLYELKAQSGDTFFYRASLKLATLVKAAMRHAPTVLELTGDALSEVAKIMGGE